jgi:acetyl-CoA carboxylase carboxyltransferase component
VTASPAEPNRPSADPASTGAAPTAGERRAVDRRFGRRSRRTTSTAGLTGGLTGGVASPAGYDTEGQALSHHVGLRTKTSSMARAGTSDLDGRLAPGRFVVVASVGPGANLGAMDSTAAEVLTHAAEAANQMRVPLIVILASSGANVVEGIAALHGWGRSARAVGSCSGIVPVIAIVDGPAVSGQALVLGLADLVVMTERAYAFVSGPAMVAEVTGIAVDNSSLGSAALHSRETGVASTVTADMESALDTVADWLEFLPDSVDAEPVQVFSGDDPQRNCDLLDGIIPSSSTGSYDVRNVIRDIVDSDDFLELKARWAAHLVVGFARIDGRSVGVLANQPLALAGTLDIKSAHKGAWFVSLCDAFNLPIITLVDTPGYFPGKDLEWRGMIRHGAQMAFAYAEASVPRICVVMRKAFGGAYIVMDSKTMGNDLNVAWPSAELAVMGAKGAVQILHKRSSEEERIKAEVDYEADYLNPYVAAERGLVDAVIAPSETRSVIASALSVLCSKRELLSPRSHGNSPL